MASVSVGVASRNTSTEEGAGVARRTRRSGRRPGHCSPLQRGSPCRDTDSYGLTRTSAGAAAAIRCARHLAMARVAGGARWPSEGGETQPLVVQLDTRLAIGVWPARIRGVPCQARNCRCPGTAIRVEAASNAPRRRPDRPGRRATPAPPRCWQLRIPRRRRDTPTLTDATPQRVTKRPLARGDQAGRTVRYAAAPSRHRGRRHPCTIARKTAAHAQPTSPAFRDRRFGQF